MSGSVVWRSVQGITTQIFCQLDYTFQQMSVSMHYSELQVALFRETVFFRKRLKIWYLMHYLGVTSSTTWSCFLPIAVENLVWWSLMFIHRHLSLLNKLDYVFETVWFLLFPMTSKKTVTCQQYHRTLLCLTVMSCTKSVGRGLRTLERAQCLCVNENTKKVGLVFLMPLCMYRVRF